MTDGELRDFLESLRMKELEGSYEPRLISPVALPDGFELIPMKSSRMITLSEIKYFRGSLDLLKENVIRALLSQIVNVIDERGLLDLDSRLVGENVEFTARVLVVKDKMGETPRTGTVKYYPTD